MHQCITQHVGGQGRGIMKKVVHYKKLAPVTGKLEPKTGNKNNVFCRPRHSLHFLRNLQQNNGISGELSLRKLNYAPFVFRC